MKLFRNDKSGVLAVVGEKNIHRMSMHRDMTSRGFKFLGAFNGTWDSFDKNFTQIYSMKIYDKFMQDTPLTDKARLEQLERRIISLTIKLKEVK